MSPRLLSPLLLTSCLLLTACGGPAAPTFTVAEAYVAQRSEDGTRVNIAIDARNNSGQTIPLWKLDYTVDIAGNTERGTISRWAEATLAPNSTVRFEIPVITRATGPSAVHVNGTINYIPGGRVRELLTEIGIPLPSASVAGNTTVNLDESPRPPAGTAVRIITAKLIEAPPTPVVDTLPPIQKN